MLPVNEVRKVLSANDTGETGAHQAGILVPKDPRVLEFFPSLDPSRKNPRLFLTFIDEGDASWNFSFIYYNNKFFDGTRNEYRLTRMTDFIRINNMKQGDTIVLKKDKKGLYRIYCHHEKIGALDENGVLILRGGWKVISF